MFYEPHRRRKRRRRGCLSRLLRLIVVLAVVYCVVTVATTTTSLKGIFKREYPDGIPGGWRNILLLGSDSVSSSGGRSDTIIIASISMDGRVKLSSIMRDTLVEIDGHGFQKINAAYAFNGVKGTIDIVNRYFDMDIRQYLLIDFQGFVDFIDAIGGIEIDVTEEEAKTINKKSGHKLKSYGKVTLDGIQALRYVRIRKIDSDYKRTNRQRKMLSAVLQKVRSVHSIRKLMDILDKGLDCVSTNISKADLLLLGGKILLRGSTPDQLRLPVNNTFVSGMKGKIWCIEADFEKNTKILHQFIYESEMVEQDDAA